MPFAAARTRLAGGAGTGIAVSPWLLLPILAMLGFSGRDTYGAVPPLFPDIKDALGLSGFALGLLTAVPTACMGLFAPPAQRLAARIGAERTLAVAVALLAVGKAVRLASGDSVVLFASSAVVGACMGAISTLVPAFIAGHLGGVRGLATGVFALSLAAGTGIGAYLAVPLAHALGGWKQSIAFWAIPTAATGLAWVLLLPRLRQANVAQHEGVVRAGEMSLVAPVPAARGLPWRSPTARWVTAFVCLQSIVAFSAVAWLIPLLDATGWSSSRSAAMMLIFQTAQAGAMLLVPYYADRMWSKRAVLAASLVCTLAGVIALAVRPAALAVVASVLLGIGLGGGFSLGFVLIMDYTRTRYDAARFAAMVFLVAYVVAAFGPLAVGLLHDLTGGYRAGFIALAAVLAVQVAMVVPLRPGRTISDEPAARDSAGRRRPANWAHRRHGRRS